MAVAVFDFPEMVLYFPPAGDLISPYFRQFRYALQWGKSLVSACFQNCESA